MSNKTEINVKLPGFFVSLLTILFIGLKLTNYIDWSWWWILSPLWIPISITIIMVLIMLFCYFMLS